MNPWKEKLAEANWGREGNNKLLTWFLDALLTLALSGIKQMSYR